MRGVGGSTRPFNTSCAGALPLPPPSRPTSIICSQPLSAGVSDPQGPSIKRLTTVCPLRLAQVSISSRSLIVGWMPCMAATCSSRVNLLESLQLVRAGHLPPARTSMQVTLSRETLCLAAWAGLKRKWIWKRSMYGNGACMCAYIVSSLPQRKKFYHSGLRFKEIEVLLETMGFILSLGLGRRRA